MVEFLIHEDEQGRRILSFLHHVMPKAPDSFFFKALRQNKIKVNGRKPDDLKMVLSAGDHLTLYFTDSQLEDFGYAVSKSLKEAGESTVPSGLAKVKAPVTAKELPFGIVYEDQQVLIVDKPAGLAVQKGENDPVSLTELARAYLLSRGARFHEGFQPSFCHRLDKNTPGLVVMAKTLSSSQVITRMIRERQIRKTYLALVEGDASGWKEETRLSHLFSRDEKTRKTVLKKSVGQGAAGEGEKSCESLVRLCQKGFWNHDPKKPVSLVRIELLTGRTHQIRAQLAFEGHPIVGDVKYGSSLPHRQGQLLCASRLDFPDCPDPISSLSGRTFTSSYAFAWKQFL